MVQVAACLLSHLSSCKLHSQPNSATGLSREVDAALVTISATPISTSLQTSSPALSTVAFSFSIVFSFFFQCPLRHVMTHEPSVGLQLLSLFHRRAFRAEAGTASRRKLSSKALVPNMILQRQHAPFFFLKGRKLRYVDGSVAACSLLDGAAAIRGSFSLLFLIFFLRDENY